MNISLQEISHSFGETQALKNMSLSLPSGYVTGFVGNNGAGKSTAIRVLVGLLKPDHGRVLIDGHSATRQEQSRIGYVPEERGLYQQDRVAQQLLYIAQTFGLPKTKAKESIQEGLERFGITGYADTKLADLSLGNQQRVQIICALLGDPDTLVLDEPFSGLDPQAVGELAEILRQLAHAEGKSVLFSSHQLDVVEDVSDRVAFIKEGKVEVEDHIDALTGNQHFALTYRDGQGAEHNQLAQSPTQLTALICALENRGLTVTDIKPEKRGLIHVFRQYSGQQEEEKA